VAGALAERDFVAKLEKVGFAEISVLERRAFGIKEAELYPLFGEELLTLMRRLIPPGRRDRIATSMVVKARLTGSASP
jgi:hypothetical protein